MSSVFASLAVRRWSPEINNSAALETLGADLERHSVVVARDSRLLRYSVDTIVSLGEETLWYSVRILFQRLLA